jgi:hypothetical protein
VLKVVYPPVCGIVCRIGSIHKQTVEQTLDDPEGQICCELNIESDAKRYIMNESALYYTKNSDAKRYIMNESALYYIKNSYAKRYIMNESALYYIKNSGFHTSYPIGMNNSYRELT